MGRRKPKPGDRMLIGMGTIESVHDDFVMVRADHCAPHAVPLEYGLVAIWRSALEPEGDLPWQTPLGGLPPVPQQ